MRRVVIPELLDVDAGSEAEIRHSLADLRRINSWFGGVATTLAMFRQATRNRIRPSFSLLDVGSGCGDIALSVERAMHRRRIHVDVTLLDRRLSHLLAAPVRNGFPSERHQSLRDNADGTRSPVRRVVGDALALPFTDSSFDLVSCALLAHHLEPAQLKTFVSEALRVCRLAVLINDLRRSAASLSLVYAGFPLFRSRMTRHDSVASVRRAYTMKEMETMLDQHGVGKIEIAPHYLFRMGAVIWKESGTEC
jgi:ubiquinone/menaquinone biosynthesis C-methylase UbiE